MLWPITCFYDKKNNLLVVQPIIFAFPQLWNSLIYYNDSYRVTNLERLVLLEQLLVSVELIVVTKMILIPIGLGFW